MAVISMHFLDQITRFYKDETLTSMQKFQEAYMFYYTRQSMSDQFCYRWEIAPWKMGMFEKSRNLKKIDHKINNISLI